MTWKIEPALSHTSKSIVFLSISLIIIRGVYNTQNSSNVALFNGHLFMYSSKMMPVRLRN